MEKAMHYTALLSSAILDAIQNEDSEFYIGGNEELEQDDNMTEFSHALLNLAPMMIFQKLTGNNGNILELNHIANQLVFQFSEKELSKDSQG